jgi:hypothetical protein
VSCSHSPTEKHQGKRGNIFNVRAEVKEITTGNALIGSNTRMYILSEYIVIADYTSPDEVIHILDKNSFHYLLSAVNKGQGSGELTRLIHIGVNEPQRRFYASDYGKYKIFDYQIDSLIAYPSSYIPQVKMIMDEGKFPDAYKYIEDTLCIGVIWEPIGNADYKPSVGKWNMLTGDIQLMKYDHPQIEKKRIEFDVSMEHGIYVECYRNHDLMTICSLDGELKYNIYGSKWDTFVTFRTLYYNAVAICGDKIVALYSGEKHYGEAEGGGVSYPTKFLVFDLNGDYIKTLETGYQITRICYDEENKRMLMTLNDDMQFAYFDIGKYL